MSTSNEKELSDEQKKWEDAGKDPNVQPRRYVHTVGLKEIEKFKYEPHASIFRQTGNALIALEPKSALVESRSASDKNSSADVQAGIINNFKNEMNIGGEFPFLRDIWIDSAGYSIVAGKIKFEDAKDFSDIYINFLEKHCNIFSFAFTLDAPYFINEADKNTYTTIKTLNENFTKDLIDRITDNESLQVNLKEKIYYVHHFKIKEQYDIFNGIWKNMDIPNSLTTNQAIGGLVGVNRKFSIFIPMLFKCFHNYLRMDKRPTTFNCHLLGVHSHVARFTIYLIKNLFEYIMREKLDMKDSSVNITYDSRQFYNRYQYKDGNPLLNYPLEKVISTIYTNFQEAKWFFDNYDLHEKMREESQAIKFKEASLIEKQKNVKNQSINKVSLDYNYFVPAVVFAQNQVDRIFMKEEYIKQSDAILKQIAVKKKEIGGVDPEVLQVMNERYEYYCKLKQHINENTNCGHDQDKEIQISKLLHDSSSSESRMNDLLSLINVSLENSSDLDVMEYHQKESFFRKISANIKAVAEILCVFNDGNIYEKDMDIIMYTWIKKIGFEGKIKK